MGERMIPQTTKQKKESSWSGRSWSMFSKFTQLIHQWTNAPSQPIPCWQLFTEKSTQKSRSHQKISWKEPYENSLQYELWQTSEIRKKKNSLKHSCFAVKSTAPILEGKTMYMLVKLIANVAVSNVCIYCEIFGIFCTSWTVQGKQMSQILSIRISRNY